MMLRRPRLALVLLGDRLVAGAVRGQRLETFGVDSEQPATTLRAELDQRHLGVRNVALGLPRTAVTVKPIDIPDVGGELRDMVQFELERHLPFASDDASFDFIPLPASPTPVADGSRRVLIAAADRKVVEGALRLAEDARLRPTSLTVAAHDLPALVAGRQRGHVAWLHRLGSLTVLIFLSDGQLVLSRSVTTTDDSTLAAEIQRSLAVTRWTAVDAIWRSGDGEEMETPPESPLARLGAPVMEPPYSARARALLAQINDPEPGAAQLTAAVALAAERRVRPLNLLPTRLRPRRLTRQQIGALGALAAAVILGITALLVPGYRESRRLTRVNGSIVALDGQVRAVEQTLQELERKRRLLATIKSVESSTIRPLPVLRELTDLLPSDAWLTTLSLDSKGAELTGQAAAASSLIPVLENSPRFERVEFASPVTRGREKEQFRIRTAWEESGSAPVAKPAGPRGGSRESRPLSDWERMRGDR
ncbi:MAG TPA: PilN domain-containing protein [Candidatus Acidoferrum sp.]|nr:PilN domain-containing protein [Candidatus Acidoferrum sp.]